MFSMRDVTLQRGTHILFKDASLTIYPKQKIGIIGANGAGKSSLFLMLLNQLHPDKGTLELSRSVTIAHVAQETPGTNETAIEFVLSGDKEFTTINQQLSEAEHKQDGYLIASLHEKLHIIDGYTAPARAAELLDGLGFTDAEQQQPVRSFSGGWRVRLNLARALMCRSDILLLDEPTNHLDLDAVLWLQNWLKNYSGTLLIISHDRDFLDAIVSEIVHVSNQQMKIYSGNYSAFEKAHAQALLLQQALFDKQQKHLAHLQKFVDRFRYKASKAKQAQSRLKAIEKMELVAAIQSESSFQFEFYPPAVVPNPLLKLDRVSIQYDDKLILQNINFSIIPKARIALVGPNGAGKSSLIKLIAGKLQPSTGSIERAPGIKIGYFAQHQVDELRLNESAYDHLYHLANHETPERLRTYLGSFGFTGDKVFQSIQHFSGGEKARLALALLVWQRPNLLLLDEPTNHLDLEMRQALSLALQSYEGALILVTHDRFLVRTTVDELILIAEQKFTPFTGDLEDYQDWLFAFKRQHKSSQTSQTNSRKEVRQASAKKRENSREFKLKLENLEKEIYKLTQKLKQLESDLSDATIYQPENKELLKEQLRLQADYKKALSDKEEEWLRLQN